MRERGKQRLKEEEEEERVEGELLRSAVRGGVLVWVASGSCE